MSVFKRGLKLFFAIAAATSGSMSLAETPFHPFAESLDVDPDYQLFAPVDIQELEEKSARKRANHGWYVAYDRLNIGFDRPEAASQPSKIDMTWGNRWDVGYMNKKDSGWLASFTSVSGPNVYLDQRIPRLTQPPAPTATNPLERFDRTNPRFFFDPAFGDGTFVVKNSLNVGNLSSFELNKTWRLEPYRYGGILEPMLGFRYMQFTDYAQNDDYQIIAALDPTDVTPPIGLIAVETLQRQVTRTDNRMVLAQIGYRYFTTVKRMTFANETRIFAGQNFQTQGYRSDLYGYGAGTGTGTTVVFSDPQTSYAGRDNAEFVIGLDARLEGAIQVTRAFNLRAGCQMLYIGRGVWRGANPGFGPQNNQNQDVVSPALTFGATFNR